MFEFKKKLHVPTTRPPRPTLILKNPFQPAQHPTRSAHINFKKLIHLNPFNIPPATHNLKPFPPYIALNRPRPTSAPLPSLPQRYYKKLGNCIFFFS